MGELTSGEKKISSQLAFNSFMTGVNVYSNMKINKSMQEANALNQQLKEESIKQSSMMEQDLAIKKKEQDEKEFIKQVKESVFQLNTELQKLTNEKDLLNTFISLESLYASLVSNNITTDVVPDMKDKEFIQSVYDGIEKLKKETESNFSKKDNDDRSILIDILEEDEEEIIGDIEKDEFFQYMKKTEQKLSSVNSYSDVEFVKMVLSVFDDKQTRTGKYVDNETYFSKKGYVGEKKKSGKWWVFVVILGFLEFGWYKMYFSMMEEFATGRVNGWESYWSIVGGTTLFMLFSIYKIIDNKTHNKKCDEWVERKFTEGERNEFVSSVKGKIIPEEDWKLYEKHTNRIKDLKETILKEIPMTKELVARRPFLIDLFKARLIDV